MTTILQAESAARQDSWQFKQNMHVVEEGGRFYAISDSALANNPQARHISTFSYRKGKAGAKKTLVIA